MTTRRTFFKLIAGAALAPVLPDIAHADIPRIVGDGYHDDGPGLNALIRGEVVEFASPEMADSAGWVGDVLTFPRFCKTFQEWVMLLALLVRLIHKAAKMTMQSAYRSRSTSQISHFQNDIRARVAF